MTGKLAILAVIGVIVVFGALTFAKFPDRSAQEQAINYCRLVHDGAWPDYDHVYARQCKKDGSVNWKYIHQSE